MSRKVGLGDTHFDPDIDGDVDFDFFGGVGVYEEGDDLIQNNDSSYQEEFASRCKLKIKANHPALKELATTSSNNLLDNHKTTLTISETCGTSADTNGHSTIINNFDTLDSFSSGADDTVKSWVMGPEAEQLLPKKLISQAVPDSHDDAKCKTISHDNNYWSGSLLENVESATTRIEDECVIVGSFDHTSNYLSVPAMVEETSLLDMKLLSRAIADLKFQNEHQNVYKHRNIDRQASSPRSATDTFNKALARPRKNMTFSNDEVRRIDHENKLLLKKIIRAQNPSVQQKRQLPIPPPIVAHSAINRMKEFKKIESENLVLLKRLQAVKPTMSLHRNYDKKSRFAGRSRCSLSITDSISTVNDAKRKRTRVNSSSSLPSWTGTESETINLSSQASSASIKLPKLTTGPTVH